MTEIIKKFVGYSKSDVLLLKHDNRYIVRKIYNIDRNLERYKKLSELDLPIPNIILVTNDYYDMEYIPNISVKQYLLTNSPKKLIDFLHMVISKCSNNNIMKDYTFIYKSKLQYIDFSDIPFTKEELIYRLPKMLPCSDYHGDLTLDNILYNTKTNDFVLIDPITTEYDSYVFDLAKLNQDIVCKWFIRKESVHISSKLKKISDELNMFPYYDNKYIIILMLLRIMPYAIENDKNFLKEEIKKLWK